MKLRLSHKNAKTIKRNKMTKNNQIIFIKGKREGLKTLFNSSNFGYLAVGYADDANNGFKNPTSEETQDAGGFKEISKNEHETYERIPLEFVTDFIDYNQGRVTCRFTATLKTTNIIDNTEINQFAICDNIDPYDGDTTFYCASTFPSFTKNDNLEISFTIDLGL